MIRLLPAVLLGVVIAGCAAYWKEHTEGTSGPIAWYITGVSHLLHMVFFTGLCGS